MECSITANKRLGQHFILDQNINEKITKIADIKADDLVVEVGPGPGGLTKALLETGAKIIAVEKDQRFLENLELLKQKFPEQLIILHQDALNFNYNEPLNFHGSHNSYKIVSNLPYNIGTELLVNWLINYSNISSFTLMFQKEVAMRITANYGDKNYGRLSVLAQFLCDCREKLELSPQVFTPPPKVFSAVVSLTPKNNINRTLVAPLEKLTRAIFGQRRKMLRTSLRQLLTENEIVDLLNKVSIPTTERPENLSVTQIVAMAKLL